MKTRIGSRRDKAEQLAKFAAAAERAIRKLEVKELKTPLTPDEVISMNNLKEQVKEYRNEQSRYQLTAKLCGNEMLVIKEG